MTLDAEQAWGDLLDALEGIDEKQAWAIPSMRGTGDLATRGSILEIVQHLATSKIMYASAAFRQNEFGWDDVFARVRELGANWQDNINHLHDAHRYWMTSWANLTEQDLTSPRMTNWGAYWPAWRIISTISHHDSYHSGQISLLRAILPPAELPCPTQADYSLVSLDQGR
ncbi:MAG: hypothetical protein P4L33_22215 [Capsulimonadaceae bacterium]|nr:hypothetical protein [Capsulimonadaceae bacterium]